MTCDECRKVCAEKGVFGSTRAERAAFTKHLKGCAGCMSWLDQRVRDSCGISGEVTVEKLVTKAVERGVPIMPILEKYHDDHRDQEFREAKG